MNQPRLVGGRYQLLQQLGRGGMGIVWRAQDTAIGREVAIKQVLIPPNLAPGDQMALGRRMLHEARSAAQIRHPAVVAVHDVVEDGGTPWIVMELVRGRSLDQVVKQGGPMTTEWAASIGLFVLSALATAHAMGMLHRDVKPGNVLLADDGRILLSDFGIATQAGQGQSAPMGTAGFTAPESLTQDGPPPGPAADLFSLGATLYTAVEGVPPFQRPTSMATLGAVMTEPFRPPHRAGALGQLLAGMLAKHPAQRPDTATVRQVLQQVTGQTAATVRSGRPAAWMVPKVPALASAAAVVVAFVVAVALILTTSSPATSVTRQPVSAPSEAPTTADPAPSESATPSESTTPSGTPIPLATSAAPAPGKFTKVPRPCQLLSRQQATELIGGPFITSSLDQSSRCTWGPSTNTIPDNQDLSLYLTLYLYPQQGDGYETTLAAEHIAGAKAAAEAEAGRGGTAKRQGEVFEISGAGDEAIAWEIQQTGSGNRREVEVRVRFRTSNMVGDFRFNRGVAKDPKLRDRAAQAAKYLVASLNAKA